LRQGSRINDFGTHHVNAKIIEDGHPTKIPDANHKPQRRCLAKPRARAPYEKPARKFKQSAIVATSSASDDSG
jgi:hypothetical protein